MAGPAARHGRSSDPFDIDGHRIDIGASIGIAMAPVDGVDADQLLKKADMALYAAKNGGGGDHRFFALEMEEAAQERRALELDCAKRSLRAQFELHFQPLVDLRSGRVTTLRSAAALARTRGAEWCRRRSLSRLPKRPV